ncbi:MAG: hypothetical protein ACK56I_34590, partial [bacterium]
IHAHQHGIFKHIAQHRRRFRVVFRKHLELFIAGHRLAIRPRPGDRWLGQRLHRGFAGASS